MKKREDFKDNYKFNTISLYKSDKEALKDLNLIEKEIKKFKKYKGHILDSANTLLEILEFDKEISMKLERAYIYGHLNNDADTLNTNYQELFGKCRNVYTNYLEATAYIVPELLLSDYNIVKKYIKENKKLNEYKRELNNVYRRKKHILNSDVEEVLSNYSKLMGSFDEIMGALTDSDFKFSDIIVDGKKTELTESNFSIYLRHENRDVRKQAFDSIYKTYGDFRHTLAAILKNEVEKNCVNAKLRKYKNSLEASLYSDEINSKVYYNLIESVHKNLKYLYKYWDLKKELLGLKELHLYDTYADVIKNSHKSYSYEEAKELVLKAVKPLGETYVNDILKAFDEGWIDSCNNEGKRGGAYCTACYLTHPYVLMSYEGKLNDVSTLIHELGHAMHYYYACKYQNYQDYSYTIFVAEVASQVNEILLCRYLLDNTQDNQEKLKIVDELLQKYKASVFRQTMFAEFELFLHEFTENGGVLTEKNMCDKYYELNKLYFGDNVIVDENIKYEWERIPHFYMNFYVFQYATGFIAAINLANQIYEGNQEIRNKYLEFLKLGCTKNPIESLEVAGIDMLDEKVFDDAIEFMNYLMKKYTELKDGK